MLKNRVFLDSSILITALLSSRGGSFYILTQLKGEFHFQINNYVLEEIFEVLDKKFYSQKELKNYLFLLLGLAKIGILPNPSQSSLKRFSKIINKEDAPILASALSNSNYLLTLDKDFLNEKIRNFARENNVLIFTPKEFISFLRMK
ncbi:MAG: putative toxin-antitoxin system toxin component, PIN family [Patescibacteria group bacterium]